MVKVRYINWKPLWFPKLKAYPGGKAVKQGDEIKLSLKEWNSIKNMKNGNLLCFEEIKIKKRENTKEKDIELWQ